MKKLFIPVIALVMAFAASAFTTNKVVSSAKEVESSDVWFYVGTNLTGDTNAANYTKTDHSDDCNSGSALPCQITVQNAPDQTSLQSFLNGKSDTDIRDVYADSQREQ